jgi:lycopene cyclase domain-containing protein
MQHFTYLAILAACALGSSSLEFLVHTGVYRRWRRLLTAVVPVAVVGITWDRYALARRQWTIERRYVTGLSIGGVPIEEILFFLVIPCCAVLTIEAVRQRRPHWRIGDEKPPRPGPTASAGVEAP